MIVSLLFYTAAIILIAGLGRKIVQYTLTPAPLKIPTTPAPTTKAGVVWRMAKEVFVFESLFKASKFTWVFGWLFHAGLFIVILSHLKYFIDPVWGWVVMLSQLSRYAAIAMVAGLLGLLARRLLVDRVRYISAPSDYLMLILFLVIGGAGLAIRYVSPHDIALARIFGRGIAQLELVGVPGAGVLLLHIIMVIILIIIFPFSKLLHAPGVFFSPSRNQVDNSRERRHVSANSDSGRKL